MSSTPPLQCLFCNHLNPGGASFCNDCGSQMHLQPCDRCGAINKRAAKICHKCQSSFTLPGTSAKEVKPAPLHTTENAHIERRMASASNEENITGFANTASPEQAGIADEPPQFYQLVSPQSHVQDIHAKDRPAWRLKALTAVMAVSAVAAYFYRPKELPPATVSAVVVAPEIAPALPPATPPPTITGLPHAAIKPDPDTTIAQDPPGAGPARPPLLPTTSAETTERPTPPLLKECPDAVAVLGLCNQSPQ